jgi:hypothetical protein
MLGGAMSVAIGLLVTISVTMRSRWLGLGGVPGDFELVQMLTAMSVFCFLPFCQWRRGHVIVDAASQGWGETARHRVDGVWELLAGAFFALIAFQLAQGAWGMSASNTRSMVLALPIAPAVWVCAGLCALLAVVSVLKGIENLRWRLPAAGA